jgi:hypothetical protein
MSGRCFSAARQFRFTESLLGVLVFLGYSEEIVGMAAPLRREGLRILFCNFSGA